jgi:hypothetical protein
VSRRVPEIKTLEWNDEQYAFFSSGHIDKAAFLDAAQREMAREFGDYIGDDPPTSDSVQHAWFRMMSPTEARQRGYSYGYMLASAPQERKRGGPFPVTLVIV